MQNQNLGRKQVRRPSGLVLLLVFHVGRLSLGFDVEVAQSSSGFKLQNRHWMQFVFVYLETKSKAAP